MATRRSMRRQRPRRPISASSRTPFGVCPVSDAAIIALPSRRASGANERREITSSCPHVADGGNKSGHEIAGKQPSAAAFHRKRAAAIINAIGAWARCERSACRRKGACNGAGEIVPSCLPLVINDAMESVTECIAALPGVAPRPSSRA